MSVLSQGDETLEFRLFMPIQGLSVIPLLNAGSDTSMSGNGVYIPGNELGRLNLGGPEGTDLPPLYLPTGYGGGCIESGPFKDSQCNERPTISMTEY
jgi:hypothetical protein